MKRKVSVTHWLSEMPTTCDLCGCKLTTTFVDGKTKLGPWGIMCPTCHKSEGFGLGIGKGQKYNAMNDELMAGDNK